MDNAALYRATRDRIIDLVTDPATDLEGRVEACPEWSVRELLAHLTGVCDDIAAGNMDGTGTDPWTAEHVRKRGRRPVAEVVDDWQRCSEEALALLGDDVPDQLIFDEVTHEHDLRAALGRPANRSDEAVTVAVQFIGPVLHAMLGATAPPLRIRGDHQEWATEGATTTLTVSDFDLLRSGSGRRTRDQVAALDWGRADPGPWLDAFYFEPFQEPEAAVEEPGSGAEEHVD